MTISGAAISSQFVVKWTKYRTSSWLGASQICGRILSVSTYLTDATEHYSLLAIYLPTLCEA